MRVHISTGTQKSLLGCSSSSPEFVPILSCRPSSTKLSASPTPLKNSAMATSMSIFSIRKYLPTLSFKTRLSDVKLRQGEVDVIFVNTILSGIQQRNLEQILGKPVLDRVGLIIEIFNAHACTKEGKLQAELAALMYKKTRLVRLRGKAGRSTFGMDGEAEVVKGEEVGDVDSLVVQEKLNFSFNEEEFQTGGEAYCCKFKRFDALDLCTVLVGKITEALMVKVYLLLLLLGIQMLLFATVDPKLRSVVLPSGKKVLVSDTVGFISDLPVQLVEAFHATLEEVVEADLLVHVLDCTAPNLNEHRSTVLQVLEQIGVAKEKLENMIEVWNKIDYEEEGDFDERLDDSEDGEAKSLAGEDDMESELLSENDAADENLEAMDDEDGDYSDDWLASEDAEDPWGEGGSRMSLKTMDDKDGDHCNGWLASEDTKDPWGEGVSCTGLKTMEEQQSEGPQDWRTEKKLHSQGQSGPHVRTSALMGVGLQELLELIDEKLKKATQANVVERVAFDWKWRPPQTEEASVAVEH